MRCLDQQLWRCNPLGDRLQPPNSRATKIYQITGWASTVGMFPCERERERESNEGVVRIRLVRLRQDKRQTMVERYFFFFFLLSERDPTNATIHVPAWIEWAVV